MSNENTKSTDALQRRIDAEMLDSFDEELEMELDDERLSKLIEPPGEYERSYAIDRHIYFKELFRLQRELVKLQDWVVDQKLKVVVVFEGRDAAGKGGGYQTHNPKAQPSRLPGRRLAGAERSGALAVVFSALCDASSCGGRDRALRPQLVQSRGRRARHGLLHRG